MGQELVEKQRPILFSVRIGCRPCQLHTKIRNHAGQQEEMKPGSISPALDSKGSSSESKPCSHRERKGASAVAWDVPYQNQRVIESFECWMALHWSTRGCVGPAPWKMYGNRWAGSKYTKQYLQGSSKNSKKTRKDDIYPSPMRVFPPCFGLDLTDSKRPVEFIGGAG